MNEQQEQQRERLPLSFYVEHVAYVARDLSAFDERLIERIAREAERIAEDDEGLAKVLVFKTGDYFVYDLLAEDSALQALYVAVQRRVARGGGVPEWLREVLFAEVEFIARTGQEIPLSKLIEFDAFLAWVDKEEEQAMCA